MYMYVCIIVVVMMWIIVFVCGDDVVGKKIKGKNDNNIQIIKI